PPRAGSASIKPCHRDRWRTPERGPACEFFSHEEFYPRKMTLQRRLAFDLVAASSFLHSRIHRAHHGRTKNCSLSSFVSSRPASLRASAINRDKSIECREIR